MAGPNTPQELDEEKPLDPAAERVRRKLVRFMMVNLGILFAAVMAVVLALVYKSLSPVGDEAARQVASDAGPTVPSGEMLTGEISLPAGARIISHSAAGSRLTLHLRLQDGGEEILLYDLQEARPLGRFQLVPRAQ